MHAGSFSRTTSRLTIYVTSNETMKHSASLLHSTRRGLDFGLGFTWRRYRLDLHGKDVDMDSHGIYVDLDLHNLHVDFYSAGTPDLARGGVLP